jgi:hypothetical protein
MLKNFIFITVYACFMNFSFAQNSQTKSETNYTALGASFGIHLFGSSTKDKSFLPGPVLSLYFEPKLSEGGNFVINFDYGYFKSKDTDSFDEYANKYSLIFGIKYKLISNKTLYYLLIGIGGAWNGIGYKVSVGIEHTLLRMYFLKAEIFRSAGTGLDVAGHSRNKGDPSQSYGLSLGFGFKLR